MINEYMHAYVENCLSTLQSMFSPTDTSAENYDTHVKISDNYQPLNNLIVNIPFHGSLNGDFFFSVDEEEWQVAIYSILNNNSESLIFSSLKEFLNIAVDRTMQVLKKDFIDLHYCSPRIIHGQLDYASAKTTSTRIHWKLFSSIDLAISFDLMKDNIKDGPLEEVLKKIKSTSDHLTIEHDTKLHKFLPQALKALNNKMLNCFGQVEGLYEDCTNNKISELYNSMTYIQGPISSLYDWLSSMDEKPSLFNITESVSKAAKRSIDYTSSSTNIDILPPKQEYIFAPRKAIEFIVESITTNAIEALKDSTNPKIEISFFNETKYSGIKIEDNGLGVKPEDQLNIWEPFWSTKPQNNGLGLSICRYILEIYGGDILYSDSTLGGAAFTMILISGAKK